tara:strand:- start:1602 stop:1976 length:375 start_codon:yes stop_codon:yes gene_type:complete
MRTFPTILALAFLCTVTAKNVFAQTVEPEWAAKPIQCGPVYDVFSKMRDGGMETFFGGLGKSNSVNFNTPIDVFLYLTINMETQQWAAIEVNEEQTDACIVGYGQGTMFDPAELQEYTAPESFQ